MLWATDLGSESVQVCYGATRYSLGKACQITSDRTSRWSQNPSARWETEEACFQHDLIYIISECATKPTHCCDGFPELVNPFIYHRRHRCPAVMWWNYKAKLLTFYKRDLPNNKSTLNPTTTSLLLFHRQLPRTFMRGFEMQKNGDVIHRSLLSNISVIHSNCLLSNKITRVSWECSSHVVCPICDHFKKTSK